MPSSIASNEKSPTSSYESPGVQIDEDRLLLKLDWRILPIVTLLYLLSFIDRSNIGNARIAGLPEEIHLVGLQYNVCVAVFFISYCLFEVPSNMVIHKVRPNLWLAFIMFVWGSIMIAMAFVKSYSHLIAARFFLGVAEAGLFPGATYYLSRWYPRHLYGRRVGLFMSTSTIAGAFGGLLAFAIQHMDGLRNMRGWRWIFLLEGIATVLVSFLGFLFMPDYPENAKFLTTVERAYLVDRLAQDSAGLSKQFEMKFFWQAVTDYNTYLYIVMFLMTVIPSYSLSLFIPTILKGLGYSSIKAQLMSTPPLLFAAVLIIITTTWSDKVKTRGPFVFATAILGIIGYSMWYAIGTTSATAGYVATFLAAGGTFANTALILTWVAGNTGGDLKRAVVLAMVIGIGNLGGVCSSFLFRAKDAPRFLPGHGTCIGCLIAGWNYRRLNAIKDQQLVDNKDTHAFADMGDSSPAFR
ncbi:major facilitator superfamily domain-containing protein [Mycena rebaudengoi]|nr:major facilitator superfamily domain-containing protein [Mycena rebaudengoi]